MKNTTLLSAILKDTNNLITSSEFNGSCQGFCRKNFSALHRSF